MRHLPYKGDGLLISSVNIHICWAGTLFGGVLVFVFTDHVLISIRMRLLSQAFLKNNLLPKQNMKKIVRD